MPGYWNTHSDRDFEDAQSEPDEGEWREIEIDGLLEEIRGLKATIAAQQRGLDAAAEALDHVEAVMSIVQPRGHTKEYLETLSEVRAALALARGETQ